MKLIAEKLGKTSKMDRIRFVRADGSETRAEMPRQGTLPHDMIHYVVESALPLQHGFLSQVAAGSEAGFVMQAVHDHGNASVERGAIQAEALVEALQTQLWAGDFDPAMFAEAAKSVSTARGHPAYPTDGLDLRTMLYDSAQAMLARWQEVPFYQSLELKFRPSAT